MTDPFARLRRFVAELKRRKVYRVAATYAVVAFVTLQAARLIFPATTLKGLYDKLVVLAFVGFPIALVLAWAFEVTPEGVQRTSVEAEEAEGATSMSPEKRRAQSPVPMKALVGLGLLGAAVAGGWYLIGGGGESPEVSEGTVAVLPFEVSGTGADDWRDGMVSLLSTGLDGAAGLRAIADRTVFAAWEKRGAGERAASTEEALSVARQTGARYAVVGTAAGLGSDLQLSAAAYETMSGERLGQVQVRGAADSVTALAGQLTRRVLGLLAAETGQQLRAADLASVTTRSDTALRAFLAGERHLRAGNIPGAVEDYKAAVRADSGFALPYARLGRRGIYHGEFRGQYMRRAHQLSDQLPERQRRLVQALYRAEVEHHTLAAADSLRRLTEDYPDDPSIWESLGELVAHAVIPEGHLEVEKAHERAVELDPGHTPYYDHFVEVVFLLHRDSALAARRVEAVPNPEWRRLYRLGLEVVFGDSAQRQRAFAAYDTVSISPAPWPLWAPLMAPQDRGLLDTVLHRVLEREDVDPDWYAAVLFRNDLRRGQIEQALADLRQWELDEDWTACHLVHALTLGHPVPDSVAASYLAPEHLPDEPSLDRFRCAGLYLVKSERSDELEGLIRRLRATVDTTGPDGLSSGQRQAVVEELRGYRARKMGDLDRAVRLWDRSNESGRSGALWRGDLYRELGRLEAAEGWYLAAWTHPVAHEHLGRLYEEMGRPEDAAAAYRRFIAAWEDADEELRYRVEAARERLQALNGAEGAADD